MMADDVRFRPFDVTGRVMKGWAILSPEGWRDATVRRGAIKIVSDFCRTLPKKE